MLNLKPGAESSPLGGRSHLIWGQNDRSEGATALYWAVLTHNAIPGGEKHEQLIQQLQHLLRRPGDHCLLIPDNNRSLHQLRMLE